MVAVGPLRCFNSINCIGAGILSSVTGISTSGACKAATISASCSMAPDSLKSLNTGFLSSLFSTLLDN